MSSSPHNDALVISIRIGPAMVRRVLVDQGSSAEVMYFNMFQALKIPAEDLHPTEVLLVGFNGAPVWPLGKITLPVRAGSKTMEMDFIVVNVPSPYNAILGRAWIHAMEAVASTYHQVIRFIGTSGRQEDIFGDQAASK